MRVELDIDHRRKVAIAMHLISRHRDGEPCKATTYVRDNKGEWHFEQTCMGVHEEGMPPQGFLITCPGCDLIQGFEMLFNKMLDDRRGFVIDVWLEEIKQAQKLSPMGAITGPRSAWKVWRAK